MNTRWLWSGMLLASTLSLGGCGAGQYNIPPVEPVVKQKPQDDLLESITGGSGDQKPADTSAPSGGTPSGGSDEGSGGSNDSKPAEGAKPAPKK